MDVDAVILWVDGSDPQWLAEKRKYSGETGDGSICRYRDWGLLRHWFRAMEAFLPWLRQIHFVTWGHVPAFLNTAHPKLRIVRHDAFIPAQYLPTFSSHTIELNLHRIPGLAEHFIYFNDDMFPLRPMAAWDFFRDGLPCTCGSEVPWTVSGTVGIWEHAAINGLALVNRHFPKQAAVKQHRRKYVHSAYRWQDNLRTLALETLFPDRFTGFPNLHAPAAYCKSTFAAVWQAEPALLDATCRHRLRSGSDVNQWVMLWWQVASGHFAPRKIDNLVSDITNSAVTGLCDAIRQQSHAFICLNDPEEAVDFEALGQQLRRAFDGILPERSAFEKS